jgi:hypothetical protein
LGQQKEKESVLNIMDRLSDLGAHAVSGGAVGFTIRYGRNQVVDKIKSDKVKLD